MDKPKWKQTERYGEGGMDWRGVSDMDEFEKWKKDNGKQMRNDFIAFGAFSIPKWTEKAWQESAKKERAKIVTKLRKDGKTSDGAEAWHNNIADRIEQD